MEVMLCEFFDSSMIIIQHFTNPLCDKVALPPLQRAAILASGFAPAQYKLDHASEFTQLPREPADRDRGGHGAQYAAPLRRGGELREGCPR